MTNQLILTPNSDSLGDDKLADKCKSMLEALKKIGLDLIPKRSSIDEIELYCTQREASMKLCGDYPPDPYLIEAWIIFESVGDTDKKYLYKQLQEIGIRDDFNYDFLQDDDY